MSSIAENQPESFNEFEFTETEPNEDYCMIVALRLTYSEQSTYDAMLDDDYYFEEDAITGNLFVDNSPHVYPSGDIARKIDSIECYIPNSTANEMHIAVFRYDVEAVEALLRRRPVSYWDYADEHGNSPLLLAVKLGYINLSRMLIAEGFSCECSSIENGFTYHLIDEAVLTRSLPLVQDIYREVQKSGWRKWLTKKNILLDCLEKIPNFYIELKWNFSGVGPMGGVVKMFAPDDTYRIWKRGSWLRLDSTIAGFNNNFSAKRANLSLIFRGRGPILPGDVPSEMEGELLFVDKSDMTYQRVCGYY